MMKFIKGLYVRELTNRFRCEIEIDDEICECYQPISFKLSKVMKPEGKEVLLSGIQKKKSDFKYSVYAIKTEENRYALLNLQMVNSIFEKEIYKNRFSYLGDRSVVKHEAKVDGLKTDLLIDDSTIIEIKTIFSFDSTVLFPNLTSHRLLDQITKISENLGKGYRAVLILAVLTETPKKIIINSDNSEIKTTILRACQAGLNIKAYRIENVENAACVGEELEVVVE